MTKHSWLCVSCVLYVKGHCSIALGVLQAHHLGDKREGSHVKHGLVVGVTLCDARRD